MEIGMKLKNREIRRASGAIIPKIVNVAIESDSKFVGTYPVRIQEVV